MKKINNNNNETAGSPSPALQCLTGASPACADLSQRQMHFTSPQKGAARMTMHKGLNVHTLVVCRSSPPCLSLDQPWGCPSDQQPQRQGWQLHGYIWGGGLSPIVKL